MAPPPRPGAASTANQSTERSDIEAQALDLGDDTPGTGNGAVNTTGNYAMAWTSEADELANALEGSISDFWSGLL